MLSDSTLRAMGQRVQDQLLSRRDVIADVLFEITSQQALMLTIVPTFPLLPLAQRLMAFCLNFGGGEVSIPMEHGIFYWCSVCAHCTPDHCTITIGHNYDFASVAMVADLLLLGLSLSVTHASIHLTTIASSSCSCLAPAARRDDLLPLVFVYRSREDVLAAYAQFVIRVVVTGEDHPEQGQWLCCEKHRFIFVQRLILVDWLYHVHFLDASGNHHDTDESLPHRHSMQQRPSMNVMLQRLYDLLTLPMSPQQWLSEYLTFHGQEDWFLPTKTCQPKHHGSWLCCSWHIGLNALSYLFRSWHQHHVETYQMSSYVYDDDLHRGEIVSPMSSNGLALFIHLAHLSTDALSFPGWFESVPTIDATKFLYRPAATNNNDDDIKIR